MRATAAGIGLGIILAGASAWMHSPQSQAAASPVPVDANVPGYSHIYCSGFVTSALAGNEARLISGEDAGSDIVFNQGDYVYLSRGSKQGVHVGDRYSVFRPDKDALNVQWFKWQHKLVGAMGVYYEDAGQVKVVDVHPNVSTAQVTFACDYLQRGDLIRPWEERPAPPFKPAEKFEHFAPVSGKAVGMVVFGKDFSQVYGKYTTVYVNLGTNQSVKVGDYLRVFRYQGGHVETVGNFSDYQYKMYGFGSTPTAYKWNELPREIVGEGIVLNVGPNSSTVLVTYSRVDIYAGDYVEIE
jgi:hypothetical protein